MSDLDERNLTRRLRTHIDRQWDAAEWGDPESGLSLRMTNEGEWSVRRPNAFSHTVIATSRDRGQARITPGIAARYVEKPRLADAMRCAASLIYAHLDT